MDKTSESGSTSVVVAIIILVVAVLGFWYLSSNPAKEVEQAPVVETTPADIANEFNQTPDNSADLEQEANALGAEIDGL